MYDNQTISFYNSIAANYEAMMESDPANKIIRKMVSDEFKASVKEGMILDFGGGTGLDLPWLLENNYKVIFCEPSDGMRRIAIQNFQNPAIQFLENNKTNVAAWNQSLPFSEKVDAVLANFAVINCIPDLKPLFKSLPLVMKKGADLFVLILDNSFERMMQRSKRKALLTAIFGIPFKFFIHSGSKRQLVCVHTDKKIRKSSSKYFEFQKKENWSKYGFNLIHLRKK